MPSLLGSKPNQVSTNGELGTMAFQDASNVLVGNINATGVTTVQAGTASAPAITTTGDTNTGVFFPAADTIAFAEGGAEVMRITSDGNLGIGTTSPATRLHISKSADAGVTELILENSFNDTSSTDEIVQIQARFGGFDASYITTGKEEDFTSAGTRSSFMSFTTRKDGTLAERMRIDSSGRLYVGRTSEADAAAGVSLGAEGLVRANRDDGIVAIMNRNTSNGDNIVLRRSGTTVGSISVTTTATAYNTSSDYRLKENIAPMTGALATVQALKPVTYKWKTDGSDGQGFIAHELQAVVPNCVTGEKDAVDADNNPIHQGIDTSFLVATLTAAIQEQQAIINDLKARIETLESTQG
jgi:hypothetical protein